MDNQYKFSSMHTHTLFCDGRDDVETMCRAAFEKKLRAVGFSSHAPIYKKTGIKTDWNLKDERLPLYISEVEKAKNTWQNRGLDVFLGLEVDYIKGLRSAVDSDIKALNADYLIGSVHFLVPQNGAEPFTVDGPEEEFERGLREGFNGNGEALMHSYYDALAEMIVIGGFDILGHADLLKKNCQNKHYWAKEAEICRQKEIARAAAEAKIVVEVNTGGINRKKIQDTYPSETFLRYFYENKVPAIITSDAHRAEHLDGNYDIAVNTLVRAGYSKETLIYSIDNKGYYTAGC